MTIGTTPQGVGRGAAKGITANVTNAGIIASIGPRRKYNLDAEAGNVSSFSKFFKPSAIGWSSPIGPTLLGPSLS